MQLVSIDTRIIPLFRHGDKRHPALAFRGRRQGRQGSGFRGQGSGVRGQGYTFLILILPRERGARRAGHVFIRLSCAAHREVRPPTQDHHNAPGRGARRAGHGHLRNNKIPDGRHARRLLSLCPFRALVGGEDGPPACFRLSG